MQTAPQRISSCFTVLLTFLALCAGASAQEAASPESPKQENQQMGRQGKIVSQIWWNQPTKIEEFKLKAEQRAQMDAILVDYLENRQGEKEAQEGALQAFGEALGGGNEAAARKQGENLAEVMADPIRAQVEMMVAVTALLTAEQRTAIVQKYPQFFSRLWILTGSPRSLMKGRRSRGRQ